MKKFDLHRVVVSCNEYLFYYRREKNDRNGNARFRVFIIDPDGPAVHETIFKCYESQIPERVTAYIEFTTGVAIPF
jgi:hypothetical protein